jgi:hypothetical protein
VCRTAETSVKLSRKRTQLANQTGKLIHIAREPTLRCKLDLRFVRSGYRSRLLHLLHVALFRILEARPAGVGRLDALNSLIAATSNVPRLRHLPLAAHIPQPVLPRVEHKHRLALPASVSKTLRGDGHPPHRERRPDFRWLLLLLLLWRGLELCHADQLVLHEPGGMLYDYP